MKILLSIAISLATLTSYSQEKIQGALYDYKTGLPIKVSKIDTTWVYLSGDKTFKYALDQNGHFNVQEKDIEKLGENFSFVIDNPNPIDVDNTFASMDIQHIPTDKLNLFLSKILVAKAYWKRYKDDPRVIIMQKNRFVTDNKKTFADSAFVADNGSIKYRLHVKHSNVQSPTMYDMYVSDFRTDLVK